MVLEGRRAEPSSSPSSSKDSQEQDSEDDASVTEEEEEEVGGVVALPQEKANFGNICVSNSSDVHFGNRTFYQGPVTIKQFLYANQVENNNADPSHLAIKDSAPANVIVDDDSGLVLDSSPTDVESLKNGIHKLPCVQNHSGVRKGAQWLQNFSHKHLIVVISLVIVLLVSLLTLMAVLLVKHLPGNTPQGVPFPSDTSELDDADPSEPHLDPNINVTLSGKLKIVTRLEWLAQPAVQPANNLPLPVPYVIIWHTATENCTDQASCTFHVRFIQSFHIDSRKWWDIGYNFLVGGDGYAYEGRGWKAEGAHTFGYNARSIGIAFIGTFNDISPPARQIKAAKQLIEKGVKMGSIMGNYTLLAARQVSQTQSPGTKFFQDLKSWPHWAEAPKEE